MTDNVSAEIIAIGTEILLGEITDTNSVYLARNLRDLGINIFYMTTVGDNEGRIVDAINIALQRADVIITCGGLGPTIDDMTRSSIARATDRELVFQEILHGQIAARFAQFNATMTENNLRQAYLPENAIAIENPVGTAPAFIVEEENKTIISLPGVPREMKFLFQENVTPYLKNKYNLGIIKARIFKTAGIGESSLDTLLGEDLLNQSNPSIGLAAHHGTIDIRMTVKAPSEEHADELLDKTALLVQERAGQYIFGKGDDQLEGSFVTFLQQQKLKLAIIEAGIPDALVHSIQAVTDDPTIFSSIKSYTHPNQLPEQGNLPMRDKAIALADKLATTPGTDGAAVILSLPHEQDSADTTYATTVAIRVGEQAKSRVYGFGANHEMARIWVSRWSISYLWQMLKTTGTDSSGVGQ